ncbi:MAG: FAD-binding oxidoreductase [Thermoleophilia bacterium]|nr:FAD-binding oxidoreductase [Thermoleophilia bacterium]
MGRQQPQRRYGSHRPQAGTCRYDRPLRPGDGPPPIPRLGRVGRRHRAVGGRGAHRLRLPTTRPPDRSLQAGPLRDVETKSRDAAGGARLRDPPRSPADLADELRTSYYHGGLVDEHSAGLDPARYTAGLAAAAARRGALLFERTTVLDLQRSGPEFSVHTSQGALRSGAVLVASNGYTGYHAPGLDPWLRRRIVPIGSHILATERLDAALATRLIPRGRMVFDTKNMLFYFRRSPDNRILFGGRATFTPTSLETTSRILRQGMLAVFPELAQARIEHIWGGRVGFTFDLEPQLGVHDGIHYALGYCGHGVALGTLLGGSVARLIAGLPEDSPFLTLPFPSNPAYRGRPWFLPLAGAWFRVLDLAR